METKKERSAPGLGAGVVILIICLHIEQSGGIYTILQKRKSGKSVQWRTSLHISRSKEDQDKQITFLNNLHHPRRELRSSDPPGLA